MSPREFKISRLKKVYFLKKQKTQQKQFKV